MNYSHFSKHVARSMWEKDGKPERDTDVGSVGINEYIYRADDVIKAIRDLGYAIVKAKKP